MMTKVLFVVLLGCACVLGAPVDQSNEVAKQEASPSDQLTRNSVEQIIINIIQAIFKPLADIGKKLNTPEFIASIEEISKISENILDKNGEVKAEGEAKKAIENEINNVEESFDKLINEAAKKVDPNDKQKVDASEFKKAVEKLKEVVDKYF